MSAHVFGEVNGVPVLEISIGSKGGASARIITWGAVLRDLVVPASGGPQRVVLGLNSLSDYQAHSPHMGATAGRFANRIANGYFQIDGIGYQIPKNFLGKHSLHGGGPGLGFGTRPWKLVSHDENSVTLGLHSPDGDAGYPGNMNVTCTYTLAEPATLRVEMSATCDAPTLINLAHHSYFNLDGSSDILGHELMVPSPFRTPTDAELIPTGEIISVTGTPWDFRTSAPVGRRGTLFDGNYMIGEMPSPKDGMAHAATVRSPKNGLMMSVFTTEPCVQFYDGAKIKMPVAGLDGVIYGAHAGLCLEPQVAPDAPNRRHFPSAVLQPDAQYGQITEYRFS